MALKGFTDILLRIKIARLEGTLWQKVLGYLPTRIMFFFDVLTGYLKLSATDRRMNLSAGFSDHRSEQKHYRSNPDHLRRIIAAYKAAKSAQPQALAPFQIRGMWYEMLNLNFQKLTEALQAENIPALAAVLENFNREQCTSGSGGTGFEQDVLYRTSPLGRFYVKSVWSSYRDRLLALDVDLNDVHFPLIGNPAGPYLNGDVIQVNTFRHMYHAVEMRELLRNIPNATIVEIGGGAGGQAYQTMRLASDTVSKYLVFDIPEVSVIIAYFLLSAFPDKKIRLFGEGPVSVETTEHFEIGVFPHFAINDLADQSIDLYHNACSFSEMDALASREYVRVIERTCRRYFSHINHDVRLKIRNTDGSISVNVIGSELLPDRTLFKRLFKKPRVFALPEDRRYSRAFEYLYERLGESNL